MAEERINEIIAQEAFEQVKRLSDDLTELQNVMAGMIRTCTDLRQGVSQAVGYKEFGEAVGKVNNMATQYVKTASDRLNVERQIKAEGDKMVKILEQEEIGLHKAFLAMEQVRKSDEDLAAGVVKVDMSLSSYNKRLKDLKEEIAESGRMTDSQKEKLGELTTTINELKVQRSDMMRQLKEDANLTQGAESSYRSMNAQLVMLRNAYKSLTEEQRNNVDVGGRMRDAINNLDERLKSIDKSIGSNQRNVGNYEVILEKALNGELSMRRVMMDLQKELTQVELKRRLLGDTIAQQEAKVSELLKTEGASSDTYRQESANLDELKKKYTDMGFAINDLTEKAGMLRDVSADTQEAVKNAAQDAGGVKAMTESIGLLTQGYNALNALMAVSGADSQQLADIYNRMMIIQNGLNSINKIALALQQQSIIRVKARAIIDKVRLAIIKAQTGETAKQTAAETAETAATVANTAAEKANTAAKSGNAASTVAATAATGGLAAGEAVATATSFTLVGALKAVGVAIKSIPVIGWILAAISALGTLTVLVYKHLTAEKELTAEQVARKEVEKEIAETKKKAMESTLKEQMELDRSISKIKTLKEGTQEYDTTVKAIADKLGVNEKWLRKNIERVDELSEAWKRVRLAQAQSDAYVQAAANRQVEMEQKIIDLRAMSYKDRVKEFREMGYDKQTAKQMAQAENLERSFETIRKRAVAQSQVLVKKADEVMDTVKADMQEVNDAQSAAAKESETITTSTINKQKTASENAVEFYKSIISQMADFENKSLSNSAKGRLEILERERTAELKKYNLTEQTLRDELRKKGYTEAQIAKIDEYYAAKRKEIMEEEARRVQQSISAAYAVQVEQQLKMMELNAKAIGKKGSELSDILLDIERRRYEQESMNRQEAFKKESKDIEEGSAEWYAIRNKYNSMEELAERQHQQRMGEIRKSGIDGELEKVRSSYERMMNIMTIERNGNAPSDLEKLYLEAQMAQEQLSKLEDMTYPLDTLQRELEAGLMSEADYAVEYARILGELGMTEEEYFNKRVQMQADALEKQRKYAAAERDAIMAAANSISDSFLSIGDSFQKLAGDSLGATIAMQGISMAMVLANQAVAISAAIEKAMSDPTNINIMQAIASVAAGVAAVLAQIASAKSAIDQSRNALNSVNTYADGTSYHQGGDAVVGEGGNPELVTVKNKSFVVDKPTLIRDLPIGSKVTPLEVQTMREAPQQVDLSEVLVSMAGLRRDVSHRERVQVNVGKNVYMHIVKGANRARILSSRFGH